MKDKETYDDFLIRQLLILVAPIANTFGSRCEVVLHDLRRPQRSVIEIKNGHVTGRTIGSSLLSGRSGDKAFKLLKGKADEDLLTNYSSKSHDGKLLKSTTVLFRNKKNDPVAALCINVDITDLTSASSILNEMVKIDNQKEHKTSFDEDILETVTTMISNEVDTYPCSVRAMKKNDRLQIVRELNNQGVFVTKNAIKIVASRLNVSKHAIYGYLDEIKSLS
jgi:predicted transcriptional regulator YheO